MPCCPACSNDGALTSTVMTASRVTLHELGRSLPFLRVLRRMYATVDASVDVAVQNSPQSLACKAGCSHCCSQPIPATLLEIMGLKLYLHHLCSTELLTSLHEAKATARCFFLGSHEKCLAYTFRPIVCRRFLVGTQACEQGEDPTQTRPQHMLETDRTALMHALDMSSDFYVEHKILNTPPRTMADFKKVTVLLTSIAWREEIQGWLTTRQAPS